MATYALVLKDGSYYVEGLKTWIEDPDTLLIVVYAAGDCDTISQNGDNMYKSLYDLYQTTDDLKDGDEFTLDGKTVYRCSGVHVIPVGQEPQPL